MNRENKIMLKNIVVALLSVVLLIFIGVGCYASIINLFGIEIKKDMSSVEKKVIVSSVSLDRKVCNAIYSLNEKDKIIEDIILEFFNSQTGKVDFVTIPGNTKLKISKELVNKLKRRGFKAGETMYIRKLIELFGTENAYQYGQLILEDAFKIKISYYTVFKSNILSKYFVESTSAFYVPNISLTRSYEYELYELSESYLTMCDQVENDVTTLIEKGYMDLNTNLCLNNRLSYVEQLESADINKIYTWHIIGEERYNQFIVDKEKNTKLFEYIINTNKQYEETQDEYNEKLNVVNAMK